MGGATRNRIESETNRRASFSRALTLFFFSLTLLLPFHGSMASSSSSSLLASRSQAGQPRNRRCSCCCRHSQRILPTSRREKSENKPPAALPEALAAASLFDVAASSASWLAVQAVVASTSTATTATAGSAPYVPSPYTPGPEIWLGALLPTLVFALGSWEFGKRILIQRRCAVCAGTGLVEVPFVNSSSSSSSSSSSGPGQQQQQQQQFRKVKCRACGGFFPWESAEKFFSAATRPGNGGPLRQPSLPRQTSVLYRVPSVEEARLAAAELRERKKSGSGSGSGTEGGDDE